MKKILLIFLLLGLHNANSQNADDEYWLLDELLSTASNQRKIVVSEKSVDFAEQQTFFNKDFLQSYTEPTIGVDSKKVKKLIKKLDFDYLKAQKPERANWELSKSKLDIVKYQGTPSNVFDNIRRYNVSKPIYSKDLKMAFIYYEDICGSIDCGSSSVGIFKKCNGKWKLYVTIPITIS